MTDALLENAGLGGEVTSAGLRDLFSMLVLTGSNFKPTVNFENLTQ